MHRHNPFLLIHKSMSLLCFLHFPLTIITRGAYDVQFKNFFTIFLFLK